MVHSITQLGRKIAYKFSHLHVSVVQKESYFKAFEVCELPLNKLVHTCPHKSYKYQKWLWKLAGIR